jgi:hypothetical protein
MAGLQQYRDAQVLPVPAVLLLGVAVLDLVKPVPVSILGVPVLAVRVEPTRLTPPRLACVATENSAPVKRVTTVIRSRMMVVRATVNPLMLAKFARTLVKSAFLHKRVAIKK